MAPTTLYTACVLGGIALYLLLRTGSGLARAAAVILALGTLAWVIRESVRGLGAGPEPFVMIFGLIAVASAVRMITHHRPVYTALYFVMVVLSSAALFLLLSAEFMAFALIIVYAGAILITYLFVLMLAEQAPVAGDASRQAEYDRVPREPAVAAVVGFVMLALLGDVVFNGVPELPPPPTAARQRAAAWASLGLLPQRIRRVAAESFPGMTLADEGQLVITGGDAFVHVTDPETGGVHAAPLPDDAMPDNIELVGLGLVAKFPASLELAGVILLMAMFGAVVLARRQIELSEDQKRAAASAAAGRGEP